MRVTVAAPRFWRQPPAALVALVAILVGVALGAAVVLATPLYAIAALVGVAGLIAVLASIELALLGLVGILTLLPFFVVPIPLGGVRLTLLDVMLSLLLLTWVTALLARTANGFRASGVEPAILIFLGLALTSFMVGLGYGTTPEATRLFLKWLNSMLLFFTTVNVVRDERRAVLLVRGLMVCGAIAGAIGVFLYVAPRDLAVRIFSLLQPFGYPPANEMIRTIADTDTLRAVGTSIDPNVFGAMLAVVAAFGVTQFLAERPVLPRYQIAALLAPVLAAQLLSYSRGSWVGLVGGLAVLVLLRQQRFWLIIVGVVAVLALTLLPQDTQFLSHLESGFAARDRAAAMRLGEYKDAFILISRYPLFGVGFGEAPEIDLYVGVSSVYLLIAEQIGIPGLLAYLATLGWIGLRAVTTLPRLRGQRKGDLLLGALVALVAALVAGVFDHHFGNIRFPHMVALLWLVAGLAASLTRMSADAIGKDKAGVDTTKAH